MIDGGARHRLTATISRRRRLLLIIALCIWGAVWARAFQLQVLGSGALADVARLQSDRQVRLAAPRGEILDCEGRLLAINVARRSFFAYPDRETSVSTLARRFAAVRGSSTDRLKRAWKKRRDRFTWMARRCDERLASRIENWNLPGVYPTWEYDRAYPASIPGVAGPVGYVNDDLLGAAGLECKYDRLLRGDDGQGVFLADATGRRFTVDPVAGRRPMPGGRLHLTLDQRWQSILAEELSGAVEKWNANWGLAVLMDPYTGGILAMADVDPRRGKKAPQKCRLVADILEPGSTFKIVSFAAALSDGVVHPGEYFDGGDGVGVFSGRTIRDDKKHAVISAAEAFSNSSNVVTGRIANRLGDGRLDYWVRKFGFGRKTFVDLPGEVSGRLAVQRTSEFNIATRAIGHGVAVTPLQLAVACAAVANGGYLMRPHLVAAVEAERGKIEPVAIEGHRILSPEVACVLKRLMTRVVTEGTAKPIADADFSIAGKTGTAEKPNPQTGRYDKNKFLASFVGFYPADRPRVVGVVILDEPKPIHYGGYTAAPVLLNTVRRAAAHGEMPGERARTMIVSALPTESTTTSWSRRLVDAVAPWIGVADAYASTNGEYSVIDDEKIPERNSGSVGETGWARLLASASSSTQVVVDSDAPEWPDLRGLALREALGILRVYGADVRLKGSGQVIEQAPKPGTRMGESRTCRLVLR